MNFALGEEIEAFRREARDFFRQWMIIDGGVPRYAGGYDNDRALHRAMGEQGWIDLRNEADLAWGLKMLVLSEEAARLGIPLTGLSTTMMSGFTLMHVGTPEQCAEILPRVAAGEARIALGYSEPGAGSDIAGIRTRAVRDGDGWVIDGQKQWTSYARAADYIWLLTRTDPAAARHRGMTMFLVPMTTPGISVVPLEVLSGENPCAVFFDGVRVADRWRVGEVDGAWAVLMTALVYEHGGGTVPGRSLNGIILRQLDLGIALLRDADAEPDPAALARLGAIAIDLEISRLLTYRTTVDGAQAEEADILGAVAKVFGREAAARASEQLIDIAGPAALATWDGAGPRAVEAAIHHEFIATPIGTTVGGSVEIQRGIIAERGLGLPRAKRT